jgi:hypothetical protein
MIRKALAPPATVRSATWPNPRSSSNVRRRSAICLSEDCVEAAKTTKPCSQSYVGHRQVGIVKQPFRALHTGGLCHL